MRATKPANQSLTANPRQARLGQLDNRSFSLWVARWRPTGPLRLSQMRLLITGAAGMLGTDVAAAAIAAGHEVIALSRAQLDITDATRLPRRSTERGPDAVINCAAYTKVDAAESDPDAAAAVNASRRRQRRRRPPTGSAPGSCTSQPTTSSTAPRRSPVRRVRPDRAAIGLRRDQAAGGAGGRAQRPRGRHTIVRSSWLFGNARSLLPGDDAEAGVRAGHAQGRRRPDRLPDLHRAPRAGAGGARDRELHPGLAARRRGRRVLAGSSSRSRSLAAPARPRRSTPCTTAEFPRPAPRPAYSVLRSERGGSASPAGLARRA